MILANMSCSIGVMLYKDESEFVFYVRMPALCLSHLSLRATQIHT